MCTAPLIVCCLTDSFRGVFKRGKDTEPKTTIARKKYGILLQRRDCVRCILKQMGFSPALSFSVFPSPNAKCSVTAAVLCLFQSVTQPAVSFLLRRVLHHLLKRHLIADQRHTFPSAGDRCVQQIPVHKHRRSGQKRNDDRRVFASLRFMYGNRVRQFHRERHSGV